MNDTITRIKTILTTFVTWLVVLAGILTIVAGELVDQVGADSPVIVLILRVVAWLGTAVAIIRKVTPVLPSATGLLPVSESIPVTSRERFLARELDHQRNITP